MNLSGGAALTWFRQGLVHGLYGLDAIFPLFVSLGAEHHEARWSLYGQHDGSVRPLEQPDKLGCLTLEGGERMDVFCYVNHISTSKASYQVLRRKYKLTWFFP